MFQLTKDAKYGFQPFTPIVRMNLKSVHQVSEGLNNDTLKPSVLVSLFNGMLTIKRYYLPMSPTRQGLTQGQKPEGWLKWG